MSKHISMGGCRKRWLVSAGAVVAAVGLALLVAAGSARAASPNDFVYEVSPFVQPIDAPGGTNTFTSPFCSTRNGLPTLVCYGPGDIKTAYNYPAGLDGSGQTIVIVDAYGSPTVQEDLTAFDTQFGLSGPPGGLQVVCPAGCPTFNPRDTFHNVLGWAEETSLDVQWAHAMAPGAKLVLVVAPSSSGNAINSVEAKIFADPAYSGAIVSQSFGIPEFLVHGNNAQILQGVRNYQLARQNGMTVLASTGDFGATNGAATQNAGFPASDPDVTAVGGTEGNPYYNGRAGSGGLPLPTCAANTPCNLGLAMVQCTTLTVPGPTTAATAVCPTIGYGGEQTWNEPFLPASGGGAASLLFAAPAYQSGDGSGSNARTIPDLSYNASVSGGVLVHLGFAGLTGFFIFGGTSAGSPQMAAVLALANQAHGSNLGFVNAKLYSIAESASYAADFHDITVGNNEQLGTPTGNTAAAGYDLATGWGTPNVANLVADLAKP
jgi:subtilase family serine protease